MLNWLARVMLTISALAPVSLTYSWVAITQNEYRVAANAALVGALAIALCVLVLAVSKRRLEASTFRAATLEAADGENVGFLLLYLLPLFTDKIENLNWSLWLPVFLMIGVLVSRGYSYHFNPLLGLAGWHFYKVTSSDGMTYILLTRRHIANATAAFRVGQLTEYVLLDLGPKNDSDAVCTVPAE